MKHLRFRANLNNAWCLLLITYVNSAVWQYQKWGLGARWNKTVVVYIPVYIQQDATLHSLFISGNCSTFSGGTSTHHQERIQLYLQHLVFVTPLLLTAAIAIDTVVCAPNDGWWYHPKHVEQFPDKLCKVAFCWIYRVRQKMYTQFNERNIYGVC
jgi:hypothetical protein